MGSEEKKLSSRRQTFAALSEFRVMEWLFWLRNLMILTQLVAIVVAVRVMGLALPVMEVGVSPIVLLGFNALVFWRLETGRSASELEITLQLLFDMLLFTWLLYWTGGSINPFVSAYLVPVALAAALGRFRYALALGLVSVALYSFLMIWYVPLPPVNGRFGGEFSLHIFGMWLSFLMSAVIIIGFVFGLARLARQREIALRHAEQESINSQHLVALGSLAAGAAHELGTPLSNISMLADEIAAAECEPEEIEELVAGLRQQIALCQSQIGILRDQARHAQNPEALAGDAEQFISRVLERFRAMRSELVVKLTHQPLRARLNFDPALSQALLNLLNNAADASSENGSDRIEVDYRIADGELRLTIDDFGPGLSESRHALAGAVPFSTKSGGLGIGLLLSRANIDRVGGHLGLSNRGNGSITGVRTEVFIPVLDIPDEVEHDD